MSSPDFAAGGRHPAGGRDMSMTPDADSPVPQQRDHGAYERA
jgi:hypothetical protein